MSTYETARILGMRGINDRQFRVLMNLAEATSHEFVHISETALAARAEASCDEVREALTDLAAKGFIGPIAWGFIRDRKTGEMVHGFTGNLIIMGGSNGV